MSKYSHYESFILAILTIPAVNSMTLTRRIRITTVSMPSIFHAAAWREFQGLTREYMNLFFLTEELNNATKNA